MKTARLAVLLVFVVLLGASTPQPLYAAAGDLDLTFAGFGAGGKVVTTSQQIESIWAGPPTAGMALQADERIVVAGHRGRLVPGTTFYDVIVLRYLPNGSPDPTFGSGGRVIWEAPSATGARVNSVVVQPDGKIVLAGTYPASGDTRSFLVVRLNTDGTLDSSFGSGGMRVTKIGASIYDNYVSAMLLQPDGKIVVAGTWAYPTTGSTQFALARYDANGSLDTTFVGPTGLTPGTAVVYVSGYEIASPDIALQSDGKLVLAGRGFKESEGNDFIVVRLNADGALDTSFDGDGKRSTDFGSAQDIAYAVTIQPDDKIVVAGHDETVNNNVLVARYLTNGALDSSFDGDGKLTIPGESGGSHDAAIQSDGKIVLLGYFKSLDGDEKFAFYRLNSDGSLDTSFEGDGSAVIDMGSSTDKGYALALQADGRMLAFGTRGSYPALVQLWQDGSLDDGGKQTLGFADVLFGPGSREEADAVAIQADRKIVVAGQIADASASDKDFALARFLPDGRLDSSFGTNGRIVYGFGGDQHARAIAVQPADGKIVVGGYTVNGSAINFMIARFNPDGTPDGTFGFGGFNVVDFLGGDDYGLALALAPDGKIVMGGTAFNGARNVFGVARFNTDGTPDLTFDEDGKTLYEFYDYVGATHFGSAVIVQADRKIVLGGFAQADFALVRLTEIGGVDYGFGNLGQTVTNMGGYDYMYALLLTPGNTFVAAGARVSGGSGDFALAQYDANGVLYSPGPQQPWGKAFINFGGNETAYAVDWRTDGQIVAAGCSDGKFAWAQLPSNPAFGIYTPITGTANIVGSDECAYGVRFTGWNKIVTAGYQYINGETNMALAQFVTTQGPPPLQSFLPLIRR